MAMACAGLAAATTALAQVRPDAGSTQRDLEQRQLEAPRRPPSIPAEPVRPALKADDTVRFAVTGVRISGNKAFPAETLIALVRADLVGRQASLKDLQDAAAKITAHYRANGYIVARAYVPQQAIAQGGAEIEIAVLEGTLGGVKIENRSRLSAATVARFAAPLAPGVQLTIDTFERPILLLSDQAGVGGVNPVLRAGEAVGTSELVLELAPAPLATGVLEIDNFGNRFTGKHRVAGQVNLNSPLGIGDSFSARMTKSTSGDLDSVNVRAAVPLGGDGWRVGASYAGTRYSLGSDFANLQASGEAQVAGVFASYPIVRTQRWNLNATATYDAKRFEDRAATAGTVTPKKDRVAGFTLGGDMRDPFVANGVLAWSATLSAGRLSIDEPGARAADAATARAQGSFRKLGFSLLYLQALAERWTFYGSLLGQVAGKNLDSSEKFSLGGASGVRSYPSGEAAGDEGVLLTLELRYALPDIAGATPSVFLFTDQGRVRVNKDPFAAGSNSRNLGSAGVGFAVAKTQDFSARIIWAARTTGSAATADHDKSSRIWLQAVKYF